MLLCEVCHVATFRNYFVTLDLCVKFFHFSSGNLEFCSRCEKHAVCVEYTEAALPYASGAGVAYYKDTGEIQEVSLPMSAFEIPEAPQITQKKPKIEVECYYCKEKLDPDQGDVFWSDNIKKDHRVYMHTKCAQKFYSAVCPHCKQIIDKRELELFHNES